MPRKVSTKEQASKIKLVLEIEKYPCLYNYTLQEYSNRDIVDEAWEKVSDAVEETVNECKVKWKSLRTVFVRNLKPRANGSSGRKAPYYLDQVLQFLVPYVKAHDSGEVPSNLAPPPEDEETRKWGEEYANGSGTEGEGENNLSRNTHILESGSSEKADGTSTPKIKRKENPELNSFVEYLKEKKIKQCEPGSHRKSFLLSLLPEIDSMNDTQFRTFRRNVVGAVDNILDESYRNPCSQTRPARITSTSSLSNMQNYRQTSLKDHDASKARLYHSDEYCDILKEESE